MSEVIAFRRLTAIRAYEKVGFTHFRTIPPSNQPEPDHVMILHRPSRP